MTTSWVICENKTGTAVCETFSSTLAGAVNTAKYEAVPIRVYLAGLNRRLRRDAPTHRMDRKGE